MKVVRTFIVLLSLLATTSLEAQQVFPVHATGVIIPPFSKVISDYTGNRSQDLLFTVTLNDPVEMSRDVKFKIAVKNNGREILMTNPNFNPSPLQLLQFTPEMLTGSELAAYLNVNNLVSLTGGTPSNALPNGFTQICLEVIDLQRGVPISRQACAGGFIMDLEPPITELPGCGANVAVSPTQNLMFRWLPRHFGLPNAPTMVEYDFQLVELLPGIINPNDGFEHAIQIFQTTVLTSTLLYTETEPLLQPNKNYAWRVRIKDIQGTNIFQNNGFSNVCYFTYGQGPGQNPQASTDCSPSVTDAGPAPSPGAGNIGQITAGDEVQLGFFKLKVAQLTSSGTTFSGSGTIEVPFLKSHVKVQFEDLAVNDQLRVYQVGKVRADYDVPMGITENDLTAAGFQNKLTQTFLQDLQTYIQHPSNQKRMISGRSASDNSPIGLPLVLDKKDAQGNPLPPVVLLDLQFTERTAKLAVVAFQKDLNTNALFSFAKTSLPFTPFGIAKQGSALPLLTSIEVPMDDGSILHIFGKDNSGTNTMANITCEGFTDYDLNGQYVFSRNTILPSDGSNRKVTAAINGKIDNLFDFVAKAQPNETFQVPSLAGFTFNGNEGNFDFSAKQNPGNINFPPNYKGGQNNSWKGFDFANASLDLPPQFDFTGQGKSMKLDEGQLIIGTGGLYGRLSKTNLIGLGKGKIEDWKISMDSLTVEVTKSQLSDSYVKGKIKVPIIDDPFEYKGNFSPGTNSGDMDIVVQPDGKGGMSLWNGEITYDPNTKVKALSRLINGKRSFIPYGDFHGNFNLNFTADQFKNYLIGDKNPKITRLKKALGLTNEPNIQQKNALFKGLKVDPVAPQKDRYKLVDYDKTNAQVTIGGKTYQPTSIQLLYEPQTQDGHDELGLEIIVAEGTNLVAITVWARKDANGNYVLNRIDTDSKVVDCDCTFLPDKNSGRWGIVEPSAADGMHVSAGGDAFFDFKKLIPPVADQFPYNNGKIEIPYLSLALEVDDSGGKLVARSQPLGNFDCNNIGVETKGTVKSLDMSNVPISTGTLQNIKNHSLSNPSKLPYDLTDSLLNLLGTNYDPTKYPWPANARLILVGFEVESNRESANGKLLLVAEGEQDEWFTFGNADVLFKPNLVGFKDLKLFLTIEKKATDPVFPFIYKKSLTNEPSDGSFAYIKCEGFQHYNVQGLFSTRHAKEALFDSKTILKTTADSLKFKFIIGGSQLAKFIAPIKPTQKEFVLSSDGGKLFSTKRGYVDYDSQQDSTGMPQAFFDKTGAPKNAFRGIYIPEAEMTVWGFYEGNGSSRTPLKMDFPSLVFRKASGFWGALSDTKVVKPDGGDIGGWNYTVGFTIKDNLFDKKKMIGRLQLPIVKEKEYLPYSGVIGWNAAKKIPAAVFTTDTSKLHKLYDMPWLPGVKLNIKSGSEINFTWAVKEFVPYAKLTGAMQVRITKLDDAWKDNAPAELQKIFPLEFVIAGISFQNFNINAPEDLDSMFCGQIDPLVSGIRSISVESWGFDPSAVIQNPLPPQLTALASKLMGFGVTLDEIKMVCKEHDGSPKYKLEFVLAIDLLNENPLNNLKSGAHVPAGVVDAAKTAKNKGSRDQVLADLKKDKATLTKQFKGTGITQTKQNAAAGNAPSQAVDDDPVSDIAGLFGETNPNAPAGIGGGAAAGGGVGSGKQPPPKSLTKTTAKFNMKTNKKKGLRASGKFGIWFKNNTTNYKNGFAFDHISLDELYVKAKVSFLFLEGALLVLNNDPVYGNGFKGYIDVHVSKNTGYELQATNGKPTSFKNKSKGFGGKAVAQFGSSKYNYNYGKGAKQEAKDFNYFFVDLEAFSEKGIGGKITLHGLGGGFYFNMSREISPILKDWNDLKASAAGKKPTPAPPTIDYSKGAFKGLGEEVYKPGKSLSGFQYYPQPAVGGGYFKGIFSLFNFPQGISFDAAINIELGKNTAGNLTLSKIGLRGDIYSMAPSIADRRKAPGKGVIEITYDHMNSAFTGDFDWDLSIAYSPIIEISNKGAGGFLFAFHDATDVDWYVKIGKPALNKRIQSSYKFFGISGQSPRNYFQMGKMLDPLPGLKDVIPGWKGSDPQDKKLPKLGNGKGILFGTNMSLLSLDQKFLMFRARLEAALGFDIKLAQYKGISCNNEPLGVNGWYAQGMAYAYLKGGLDMEVDVPFFSGSINIFDFMLAATLQAELPKPTWMLGRIMGSYSVLNGLVEGDFKYKLELGKRCGTLAANPLAGIKMIEEVLPNDQEQDVPIYQDPIVTFTMPMGKILDVNITKSDGSFEKKGFKAYFKKFELTQNGQKVAGNVTIANDYYSATLALNELLKPKTDYKLEVTVGWKKNENGNWSEVAGATETRKVTFKTGARPDKIIAQALEYQAPGYRQGYWHKGYAYTQLLFKQSGWGYLFPKTSDDLKKELEKDGKKAEADQIKDGIPFNYTLKLTEISKQDGSIVKVQDFPLNKYPTDETIKSVAIAYKSGANFTYSLPYVETKEVSGKSVEFQKLNDLNLTKGSIYRIEILREPNAAFMQASTKQETQVVLNKTETTKGLEFGATVKRKVTKLDAASLSSQNSLLYKTLYEFNFGVSKYDNLADKLQDYQVGSSEKGEELTKWEHSLKDKIPQFPRTDFKGRNRYFGLQGGNEPIDQYDEIKLLKNLILTNPRVDNVASPEWETNKVTGIHPWEADLYVNQEARGLAKGAKLHKYSTKEDLSLYANDSPVNYWFFEKWIPDMLTTSKCEDDSRNLGGLSETSFKYMLKHLMLPYFLKYEGDKRVAAPQHWAFRMKLQKNLKTKLEIAEILSGKLDNNYSAGQIPGMDGNKSYLFAFEDARTRILKLQDNFIGAMNWRLYDSKFSWFVYNSKSSDHPWCRDPKFVKTILYYKAMAKNSGLGKPNFVYTKFKPGGYDFANKFVTWEFPKITGWKRFDETIPLSARKAIPNVLFKLPIAGNSPGSSGSVVGNQKLAVFLHHFGNDAAKNGYFYLEFQDLIAALDGIVLINKNKKVEFYWDKKENEAHAYTFKSDGTLDQMKIKHNLAIIKPGEQLPLKFNSDKYSVLAKIGGRFYEATFDRKNEQQKIKLNETGITAPSNWEDNLHLRIKYNPSSQKLSLASAGPTPKPGVTNPLRTSDFQRITVHQGSKRLIFIGRYNEYDGDFRIYNEETLGPKQNFSTNKKGIIITPLEEIIKVDASQPITIFIKTSRGDIQYQLQSDFWQYNQTSIPLFGNFQSMDDCAVEWPVNNYSGSTSQKGAYEFSRKNPATLKTAKVPLKGESITLEVRAKFNKLSQPLTIARNNNNDFKLSVNANKEVVFEVNASGNPTCVSAAPIKEGEWTHIAAVYDYAANEMLVYINGLLSKNRIIQSKASISKSAEIIIGNEGSYGDNDIHLDAFSVFDHAVIAPGIIQDATRIFKGTESHLALHYEFLEGPNHYTVKDVSKNSAHGTLSGDYYCSNSWKESFYKLDKVPTPACTTCRFEFDGKDDYVSLQNSIDLSNTSFTIEFVAERASSGTFDIVVGQEGNGARNALHIGFRDNDNFTFAFFGDDLEVTKSMYSAFDSRNYNHWACVYDAGTKEKKVYKNGKLVASGQASGDYTGKGKITIGAWDLNASNYFHGYIDELRIWKTARSEQQINAYSEIQVKGACDQLIAYYDFDGGLGNKVFDRKGSNHGTFINIDANSKWVSGGVHGPRQNGCGGIRVYSSGNAGLEFDGKDDYVDLGSAVNLANQSFSIEFWAARKSTGTNDFIVGQGQSGQNSALHIGFRDNDNFTFAFYGDDLDVQKSAYSENNSYHHWACVYNAQTKEKRIYRDAQLVANGTAKDHFKGSGQLTLGTWDITQSRHFHGNLDEVRIWKLVRTQQDIEHYYKKTLEGNCQDLVAYYPFSEGNGHKLADKQGYADGTLHNFDFLSGWNYGASTPDGAVNPCGKYICSDRGSCGLFFDGVDDYATAQVQGTGLTKLSVEFWLKKENNNAGKGIFQWSNQLSDQSPWILLEDKGSNLSLYVDSGGDRIKTKALQPEIWYHIAIVYDGSAWQLYTDGVLEGSYSSQIGSNTGSKIFLGSGSNGYWNGTIDEVRIWNIAKSKEDVANFKDRPISPSCPELLAYYQCDERSGDVASDKKGKAAAKLVNVSTGGGWVESDRAKTQPELNVCVFPVCNTGNCAISFNGKDSYADLGDKIFTQSFTIEFWLKPSGSGAVFGLIGQDKGLKFTRSGTDFSLEIRDIKITAPQFWNSNLGPDGWEHWAITYDHDIRQTWVYQNGKQLRVESNYAFDWPKSGSGSGYGTFAIGAMPVYNGGQIEYKEFLNGQIDEFRIWNKALPPHEIGLKKDHPVPTDCKDLVAYYKFDKGQSDVLNDTKGTNHGKLHNILLTGKWMESDRGTGNLGDCEFTAQAGNYALEFRGDENKRIVGASPVSLNQWGNSPNPFTCDMWIKTTDGDAEIFEIHKSGYDYSFNLKISSGKLDYVKKSVFNTWQNSIIKSVTPINDGKWHHIALAVNQNGQHHLYIDGKKEGFPAAPNGYYDKGSIIFGRFKGVLDEIRIWEIALDSQKIAEYAPKSLTGSENGLVHYYRLDEGPGKLEAKDGKGQSNISVASLDVLKDWVSSDVPKNFTSTPPPPPPSPTNYALNFDGSNDYVNLGNTDLKDKSFTIEFWAKRSSAGGTNDFAFGQQGVGSLKRLQIGFRGNNKFTFAFWGDDCNTDVGYTDMDWHHWACIFDVNTKEQKIYRDGQLVKTRTASNNYQGTGTLHLGSFDPSVGWWYHGLLDEVRVWDIVRTPQDISTYMNKSLTGSENGLIRYYKLNDGTGSTKAKDATGNSDGSLNNMDENTDWVPSTKGGNP